MCCNEEAEKDRCSVKTFVDECDSSTARFYSFQPFYFLDSHCHVIPLSKKEIFSSKVKKRSLSLKCESDCTASESATKSPSKLFLDSSQENKNSDDERLFLISDHSTTASKLVTSDRTVNVAEISLPLSMAKTEITQGGVVVCGTDPIADWDTIDTLLSHNSHSSFSSSESWEISSVEHNYFTDCSTGNARSSEHYKDLKILSSASCLRKKEDSAPCASSSVEKESFCLYGGFGIHPWHVLPRLEDNHAALLALESYLSRHPNAIVGEVGLDALRGPPLETVQVPVLVAQLRLAAAFQRPVSMHCVRAYQVLQRILSGGGAKDHCKSPVMFDTPGSPEHAKHASDSLCALTTPSLNCKLNSSLGMQDHASDKHQQSEFLLMAISSPSLSAEELPTSIILHGFTGSIEIAKALLRLKPLLYRKNAQESDSIASNRTVASSVSSKNNLHTLSGEGNPSHELVPPLFAQPKEKSEVQEPSTSVSRLLPDKKKKRPSLSASERLFFGIGARTTLRLKAATLRTLLPMLVATHRVLVESDEFYTIAEDKVFLDENKMEQEPCSLPEVPGVGSGNGSCSVPTFSWLLAPECGVRMCAPLPVLPSVQRVMEVLSPLVQELSTSSLRMSSSPPFSICPSPCSAVSEIKTTNENVSPSIITSKAITAAAAASFPVTEVVVSKPVFNTMSPFTKKESNSSSNQVEKEEKPMVDSAAKSAYVEEKSTATILKEYLHTSFQNAFSSVL